jgi:hypothetical protein
MTHILIDGDNISIERYFSQIYPNLLREYQNIHTTLVCQSNIVFKFVSNRILDISIKCCKTTNKNATDANIIYAAGISNAKNEKVVIVSNDKIYFEIANENCIIVNCERDKTTGHKRLRKRYIIDTIKYLKSINGPSYDVHISDFDSHFPHHNLYEVRKYIESLHGSVFISKSDCVYIKEFS